MLTRFNQEHAAGVYGVGYRIISAAYVPTVAVADATSAGFQSWPAFRPRSVGARKEDDADHRRYERDHRSRHARDGTVYCWVARERLQGVGERHPLAGLCPRAGVGSGVWWQRVDRSRRKSYSFPADCGGCSVQHRPESRAHPVVLLARAAAATLATEVLLAGLHWRSLLQLASGDRRLANLPIPTPRPRPQVAHRR